MALQRLSKVLSIAEGLGYAAQSAQAIIEDALKSLSMDHPTNADLFASLSPSSPPVALLAIYLLLPDKPPYPCSDSLLIAALKLLQSISISPKLPVRLTLVLVAAILELETDERIVDPSTGSPPSICVDAVRIEEQAARWPHGVVPKALDEARQLAAAAAAERCPRSASENTERREKWLRAWASSNASTNAISWMGARFLVRLVLTGIPRAAPLPADMLARLGPDREDAAQAAVQASSLAVLLAVLRVGRQRDPQHAQWLALQLYEAVAVPALLKALLATYSTDAPLSAAAPPYVASCLRLLRRVAENFPTALRLLARLRAPVILRRVIESHAQGTERHIALRLHCALVPYLGRRWARMPANSSLVTLFYVELSPRLFSPLVATAEPDEEGNTVVELSEMEEKTRCNRLRLYVTQLVLRYTFEEQQHQQQQQQQAKALSREIADEESQETNSNIEREAEQWVASASSAALYASYQVVR